MPTLDIGTDVIEQEEDIYSDAQASLDTNNFDEDIDWIYSTTAPSNDNYYSDTDAYDYSDTDAYDEEYDMELLDRVVGTTDTNHQLIEYIPSVSYFLVHLLGNRFVRTKPSTRYNARDHPSSVRRYLLHQNLSNQHCDDCISLKSLYQSDGIESSLLRRKLMGNKSNQDGKIYFQPNRCMKKYGQEKLPSLNDAFITEARDFSQCAKAYKGASLKHYDQAVNDCIVVRTGISTQYVYRSLYAIQLYHCFKVMWQTCYSRIVKS
jgi:hypothetical protein